MTRAHRRVSPLREPCAPLQLAAGYRRVYAGAPTHVARTSKLAACLGRPPMRSGAALHTRTDAEADTKQFDGKTSE